MLCRRASLGAQRCQPRAREVAGTGPVPTRPGVKARVRMRLPLSSREGGRPPDAPLGVSLANSGVALAPSDRPADRSAELRGRGRSGPGVCRTTPGSGPRPFCQLPRPQKEASSQGFPAEGRPRCRDALLTRRDGACWCAPCRRDRVLTYLPTGER